jgi:hypothetical protein
MTYFDCVGFYVQQAADLQALAEQAARLGRPLSTEPGFGLRRWEVGEGVELWAEVGPSGEALGVLPFFHPDLSHRAAVVAVGQDPDHPEEGWAELWVDPTDPAEPCSGRFPLVCDLVDYLCVAPRLQHLPVTVEAQLVCFADSVTAYQDALDWAAGQEATGFRMPPHAFASTWHTALDEGPDRERPEATAWLAGCVLRVERRTNPRSQGTFLRLVVDVGGPAVEVVAPEALAGAVQAGWLVQAGCWVLGRLPALEATG